MMLKARIEFATARAQPDRDQRELQHQAHLEAEDAPIAAPHTVCQAGRHRLDGARLPATRRSRSPHRRTSARLPTPWGQCVRRCRRRSTPILRAWTRAMNGSPSALAPAGQDPRIDDVHVSPDEMHIGLARGQHVLHPVGLAVAQRDRQHVALAVRGDDGFVRLTRLAAAMLDGRYARQEARRTA